MAKVLSLFDGMACGMLAMLRSGIEVERYVAFEIDKYAVKTSSHNFPMIEHKGDVFSADFTEYKGFDYLVGGSPCTYWSIAQTKNRETVASGMGWELFSQYVRALKEAQPRFFIYENNKSMSAAIRQSISETFGFEPICINFALVSAQNRQRLYWVGRRNPDGTYSQIYIHQPKDRGILLKDVLETGAPAITNKEEKAFALTSSFYKEPTFYGDCAAHNIEKKKRSMVAESVQVASLSSTNSQSGRVYSVDAKSVALTGCGGGAGAKTGLYAEPIRIPPYGSEDKSRPIGHGYSQQAGCGEGSLEMRMFSDNPSKQQVDLIAEPINTYLDEGEKSRTVMAGYYKYGMATMVTNNGFKGGTTGVAEPIEVLSEKAMDYMVRDTKGFKGSNWNFLNAPDQEDKSLCILANFHKGIPYNICAEKSELPNAYEVKDGMITVKGKQYPIKLQDGFYIIRKLTVTECKRLQTVPEWYEFPVSNSQAYKMLGNGWTVEVIAHLINATKEVI